MRNRQGCKDSLEIVIEWVSFAVLKEEEESLVAEGVKLARNSLLGSHLYMEKKTQKVKID